MKFKGLPHDVSGGLFVTSMVTAALAQEPSGRCTGIIQGAELPKLHPVRPVKNSRALSSLGFPEWGGIKQASTGEQTARRTALDSLYSG